MMRNENEGHLMMEPPKETVIQVPGETDPFIQRNDGYPFEKKKENYKYNSDCLQGWIPLAIIVSIAIAAVMFGIINILKTTYQQHTLQKENDFNLGLQSIEEQGITVSTKRLYTSDKKIKDKSNENLTASSSKHGTLPNVTNAKDSVLEDPTRTFRVNTATKNSVHQVSESFKADSVPNTYGYTLVSSLITNPTKSESGKRVLIDSKSPPLSGKGNKRVSTPKQRTSFSPQKYSTLTAKSSLLVKRTSISPSPSTRLSSIKSSTSPPDSENLSKLSTSSVQKLSLTTKLLIFTTTEQPVIRSLSPSTSIKSSTTTQRSLKSSAILSLTPLSLKTESSILITIWSSRHRSLKSTTKPSKRKSFKTPTISTLTTKSLLTKAKSLSMQTRSKLSTTPAIKSSNSTKKSLKMTGSTRTPIPKPLIITKLSLTTKRSSRKPLKQPTTIPIVRPSTTQTIRPSTTTKLPITLTTNGATTSKLSITPKTHTSTTAKSLLTSTIHTLSIASSSIKPITHTSTTAKSSITPSTRTSTTAKSSIKPTTHTSTTAKSSITPSTRTSTTAKSSITPSTPRTTKSTVTPTAHTIITAKSSLQPNNDVTLRSYSLLNTSVEQGPTTRLRNKVSKKKSSHSPQSRISSPLSPQIIKSTNSVSQSSVLSTQGTLTKPQFTRKYPVTQNAVSTRISTEVKRTTSGLSNTSAKSPSKAMLTSKSVSESTSSQISFLTQALEIEKYSTRSQGIAKVTISGKGIPPTSSTKNPFSITSTPRTPFKYRSSKFYVLYSKLQTNSSDHSITPVNNEGKTAAKLSKLSTSTSVSSRLDPNHSTDIERNENSASESTFKVIPASKRKEISIETQTPRPTVVSNVQVSLADEKTKKTTSQKMFDPTGTRKEMSANAHSGTRTIQLTTTETSITQYEKTISPTKYSKDDKKQWNVPLKCPQTDLNAEKMEFYKIGVEATNGLVELDEDNSEWSLEDDDTSENITIHSKYMYKWDLKIYRVTADVDASARVLWEDMVINVNDTASWNKDMKEVELLEQVNSCTDVVRQTMHEIAGLMSSRSLLLARQWSKRNGKFNLATSSLVSPKYPDPEDIVTGHLYPSGMMFIPNKDNPDRSTFVWFFAVDLKLGWVPQYFIDLGFMHGQKTFIRNLRGHAKTLKRKNS